MPAPAVLARVDIEGDLDGVWLLDPAGGERYEPGRPIQPGLYQILAHLSGGEPIDVGSVEVVSGERVILQCSSASMRCTHREP
ncbi:MAG TPA: hypothetical protein ENK18_19570 [Deltaproteobacteria bacterium]|nr:hypothetical protein [Deltaproteobacteria bacterium]